MRRYFVFDYKGPNFHVWSIQHLVTLSLIVLAGVLMYVFRRFLRDNDNREKTFSNLLAALLFLTVLSVQVWYLYFNKWTVKGALPAELSDVAVIVSIIMLLTDSRKLFGILYFAGIGSSIQAILTPDLGRFSFPHFRYIEFFTAHGGVIIACLFMIFVKNFRPAFKFLWWSFLVINMYGGCIFLMDKFLSANYMYLMKKPHGTSLMNWMGPWPWYILSAEAAALVLFYLLYLPFWMQSNNRRNQEVK